jgi:hypothetical protein
MRTTVTLDPDVEALLHKLMRARGLTFKQALNEAVRTALRPQRQEAFTTPTFRMGFNPELAWDKALRLAALLEDEELSRKLAARK